MSERRLHAIPLAILTLVPAILFIDVLIGSGSLYVRDVVHYHYPAKKILREIVLSGHFPWWNPYIHAGQPLAANPAHEVFYPLTWLILLPNYHFAFHLLALSHVVIACIAMYALLRSMNTGYVAATLGGLSFGIGGLVLSGLNLWPYLFSIAWLPLTCLFARRFLIERRPRDFALAVVFFGTQLLIGEPTTVFQTGLLLGLYAIWRGVAPAGEATAEGGRRDTLRNVAFVGAISVGALLLASVQVLPAADHFRDSVRSRGIPWSTVRTWSMPPARFAELVFPNFLGHAPAGDELPYWGRKLFPGRDSPFFFSIYSGLLITALAAAGVLARQHGTALFLTIAGIASILAIGDHTPLLRWLYDLGVA
ncbi:MAG TPA: hypothetical protein VHK90_13405, partial [Thermoanaerobaculia bacterium]|nr:hypothetical protein [Thermoanaerobaculia bacterium]